MPRFDLISDNDYWKDLYKDDTLADMTLTTPSGTKIKCHRLVVAVASPVLDLWIESFWKPNGCISINCSDGVLLRVLEWIYTGRTFAESLEDVLEMCHFAQRLEIHDLVTLCQNGSARGLDLENVFQVWDFAKEHKLETLDHHCILFIANNFVDLQRLEHPLIRNISNLDWEKILNNAPPGMIKNLKLERAKLVMASTKTRVCDLLQMLKGSSRRLLTVIYIGLWLIFVCIITKHQPDKNISRIPGQTNCTAVMKRCEDFNFDIVESEAT